MKRPLKVLLVEDSDFDAALLLAALQRGGYEPVCERAQTVEEMAAALERQEWDVVIADYVLPRFSGPAALKFLQSQGLDLPFIIVSGHIDEDTAVASMKAGAHDYVMKDRLNRLAPAIEREIEEAKVRRARRESEESFAREQAFRHTIEESIPSGIAAADLQGRLTYVNQAFCRMVGWNESELLGLRPPYPFWLPDETGALSARFTPAAAQKASAEPFEVRLRHRSGRVFDVLLLANPLQNDDGESIGWLGSVTDITGRKLAEERLHVQYAVAQVLSEAGSLDEAAGRVLETIGSGMKWQFGAIWQADPTESQWSCLETWQTSHTNLDGFEPALRAAPVSQESLRAKVLREGRAIWQGDLCEEADANFSQAAAAAGLLAVCGFPIRRGTEILGVVEFFLGDNTPPEEALLLWLNSIGKQIGQFLGRVMAVEALRRAHDELELRVRERTADLVEANSNLEAAIEERRRLEHELLDITEKERRRIGLDLHDDLGQKLTGLTLMVKGLEVSLRKKNVPEADQAEKISGLISQAVSHAGVLARDLALGELADKDLASALEELAANVRQLFSITCRFKVEGDLPGLNRNVVTQFYKITQEAVTNAVKHGKAHQVNVTLARTESSVVLTVRNNGLPFPSMIDKAKGMGLRIMNYRANVVGASLDVRPAGPKGTIVTCTLPLPDGDTLAVGAKK